jgi:hypothetical protein
MQLDNNCLWQLSHPTISPSLFVSPFYLGTSSPPRLPPVCQLTMPPWNLDKWCWIREQGGWMMSLLWQSFGVTEETIAREN